jgi:hypothetical protein
VQNTKSTCARGIEDCMQLGGYAVVFNAEAQGGGWVFSLGDPGQVHRTLHDRTLGTFEPTNYAAAIRGGPRTGARDTAVVIGTGIMIIA